MSILVVGKRGPCAVEKVESPKFPGSTIVLCSGVVILVRVFHGLAENHIHIGRLL